MTTQLRSTLLTAALLGGATGLLAGGAGNEPWPGGMPEPQAIEEIEEEAPALPINVVPPGMVTQYTPAPGSPALLSVTLNGVNLQFAPVPFAAQWAPAPEAQQPTWTWMFPLDTPPGNAVVVLTFADAATITWQYQVSGPQNPI